MQKFSLAVLISTLFISCTLGAVITKPRYLTDPHGNLLENNDAKFPPSTCCVIPTCQSPHECYHTLSCGYMCSTGKYLPAEYSKTPGYRLKDSYTKKACRFQECRNYEFTCSHCQDPREEHFSIYLARDDCKECYYLENV